MFSCMAGNKYALNHLLADNSPFVIMLIFDSPHKDTKAFVVSSELQENQLNMLKILQNLYLCNKSCHVSLKHTTEMLIYLINEMTHIHKETKYWIRRSLG